MADEVRVSAFAGFAEVVPTGEVRVSAFAPWAEVVPTGEVRVSAFVAWAEFDFGTNALQGNRLQGTCLVGDEGVRIANTGRINRQGSILQGEVYRANKGRP